MAKDSQRLEQEFIASAREKTGRSIEEWMPVLRESGLAKPSDLLKWLKEAHGLNHMQAGFISGIYLNDGQPVYDYEVMFKKLFEGKDTPLALYRVLEQAVQNNFDDVVMVPTKSYISIEGRKVFACATPTKTNIRIGLELGDKPFDAVVQKAKGLGAMPNITHMVEANTPGDITPGLVDLIREAYDHAHRK